MDDFLKRTPSVALALVILASIFFSGFLFGQSTIPESQKVIALENIENGMPENVDFSTFWRVWNAIDENYVPRHNGTTTVVTTEDKVNGAIQGLVRSLGDPYSVYLPPVDAKIFEDDISGNFEGVGMEIGIRDGVLTVISPLEGSPAKEAGLLAGDKIIAINDESTLDISIDAGVKKIRGEKGTSVVLLIVREDVEDPFEIEVTRDVINIPTLETQLREDGIFVIRLFNFNRDSADLFRDALRQFMLSGSKDLVLDLRGNPGGYLGAAVDMASWFLPTGKVVVQEDFAETRDAVMYRSRGYNVFGADLNMVVLVDQGSASASEILAGALQEHGIATLVGEQTFGKGSVQQVESVGSGSLKITVARWLTPNGRSISENGLIPDEVVEFSQDAVGTDPQFDKAIEILKSR